MKKQKSPYDENGRWVEERARIKGAIRRVFRLAPQMKEVLQAARVELPPALKKDGEPGKKNQVRYRCASCSELFPQKWVQVDHIEPVVPLDKSESEMTLDELARNIICDKSNLQVLCSTPTKLNKNQPSCHRIKTNKENFIRKFLIENPGHSIDQGVLRYDIYLREQEQKRLEKEQRKLKKQAKIKKG